MPLNSIPEQALLSFEALSQLSVCVHDYNGLLQAHIDVRRSWHGGKFCRAVKSSPHQHRCWEFEVPVLQKEFAALKKTNGRVHTCHAGLMEAVVPVITTDQEITAMLFAGQRRLKQWQTEITDQPSPVQTPKAPFIDRDMALHVLEALRQLAARLAHWIESETHQESSELTREQLISMFIDQHHQEPIRLADLATHLHVSVSRVAHVVKETCGFSWTELLCQARLRTACDLLLHTDHDMVSIAIMSGFGDQSQFHKIFKRHFQTSPARFRRDAEI